MATVTGAQTDDAQFEASSFERLINTRTSSRWSGWRLRLTIASVLLGCLALFGLIRTLALAPALDARWETGPRDLLVLQASADPALAPYLGRSLWRISGAGTALDVTAPTMFGAPRWTIDDADRAAQLRARATLDQLLSTGTVSLGFDDGTVVEVQPRRRGYAGLGLPFWLLAAPALLLYIVGTLVLMERPGLRNALFALMAGSQSLSLLWIGVDSGRGLTSIPPALINDLPWRLALDLMTAAAAVHIFTLHPVRLAARRPVATSAWVMAIAVALAAWHGGLEGLWWWGQGAVFLLGLAALGVLAVSFRTQPHPFAAVMGRFGTVALGTLAVVNLAVIAANWQSTVTHDVTTSAVLVWTLFFASLLTWVPFLSRVSHARLMLREFAMLAGLSTVATSLYLLFVALFPLESFASLTLAVVIALAVYAAVRQWMLKQMTGSSLLTVERAFEHLYQVAREVQKHPERQVEQLGRLLRELFDPLELLRVPRAASQTRVLADGAAMIVPAGPGTGADDRAPLSLVLRFASGGRRIFTQEDARLTDRVIEQLRRAVAYDRAVEQGRSEERLRIAQDLHDDIGARLLTLMYKAQDPDMEDYLRHTLQDLKTLTRGLAASNHLLSHAAAEWKTDLQQRLTAANLHLGWSFSFDHDLELTVVQWSALTRMLRELVSNAIYHAKATRVDICATLERGAFTLQVADNGTGRDPQGWAHGLGLGGVRKRVKLLGGEVHWRHNAAQGIVCEIKIPELLARS